MKPHYTHDCAHCTYLGSHTLFDRDLDFYTHESPDCVASLIWRYSSDPPDYGSSPIDYISPLSVEGMFAFGLYLRHHNVNGANNAFFHGAFYSNSKLVLRIPPTPL